MPDYNFLNLSPPEFENLCRDLLQKELKVHIESFTEGKDGGIDLRFAKSGKGSIIQCKRFKDYKSVFANLKKEVGKVKILNPTSYIICLSVGLTPNQKKEIKTLFHPHIQDEFCVYGRDDINNLLGKYGDVETNHYKLWLSSTNILQKILHSKVYNQTQFEEDEINELAKIYVQNDSYFEGVDILKKHHYLIISGIPGIGKTTLARITVYYLLSIGFEEFIYLSDDINDAYTHFAEDKKQVFLFDDFLGRNFLSRNFSNNEDKRILTFIDKVRKSQNKIIIFTTREYIFNQAKTKYELFNKSQFDIGKCIIDMSKYTRKVRSQILYNHIYFSSIPREYIKSIIDSGIIIKIVDHKNYNPRIIETIINKEIWKDVKAKEFPKLFASFFNFPNSVWEHVYENQITALSRYILSILCLTNAPIFYDDLLKSALNFASMFGNKYQITCNDIEYKKAIIELENTFIITIKDHENNISIDYQNPSIQDFLTQYINTKQDLLFDIIKSATFVEQLYINIFLEGENNETSIVGKNKICIKLSMINEYINKIIFDYDNLVFSGVRRVKFAHREDNDNFSWWKTKTSDFKKLSHLISKIDINKYPDFKKFVATKLNDCLNQKELKLDNEDIEKIIPLIEEFKAFITVSAYELIIKLCANISFPEEVFSFSKISNIYPDEYNQYIETDEFNEILNEVIQNELDNIDNETIENSIDNLSGLDSLFGCDTYSERRELEAKMEEINNNNKQPEIDWKDYKMDKESSAINQVDELVQMFNTLLDK